MVPDLTVSVCMITYNHEKFIAEAIEGVLIQETDFPIEIIISNDASSDQTSKIVERYLNKQDGHVKIKYFDHEKNLGMMKNAIFALDQCKGKYVAICEGDDYWTDPLKLKKQVAFLENNPDYVICCHRVFELENGRKKLSGSDHHENEQTYAIEDLAKGNLMYTLSVVYRNGLFKAFPSWFPESPVGDYVLHMLNARHGKIKYFPDAMAVYRKHDQGSWGLKNYDHQLWVAIKTIDLLLNEFDGPIKDLLIRQKGDQFSKLAKVAFELRDAKKAVDYLEKAYFYDDRLKEQWATRNYPALITNLFNSRRYKTVDRFFNFFNKNPLIRAYKKNRNKKG